MGIEKFEGNSNSSSITDLNSGLLSGINNSIMDGIDRLATYSDTVAPSSLNFMSLDLDEWMSSQYRGDSLWGTSELATPASSEKAYMQWGEQLTTHQHDKSTYNTDNITTTNNVNHDCLQEANDVLANLSFVSFGKMGSSPSSKLGSVSITECVPLDYVLRLNREASERLSRLLTCPCARSPHQALLYASIFSRVLTWYQQAETCNQGVSWIPTNPMAGSTSYNAPTSISASASASGAMPSPWLRAKFPRGDMSTPTIAQAIGVGVSHTQMDMDDQTLATMTANLVLMNIFSVASTLFTRVSAHG
ncbi:hypothetical protein F4819DRAFT_487313 [Hypoxylon fuscum]|nr:hypothetical protein F4819DRAFT_487313 [Hypoxylon fuscum]